MSGSSKPCSSVYYILNGLISTDQQSLALTFNGENEDVTVTPLDEPPSESKESSRQRWYVHDLTVGDVQGVSPVSNFGLQIVKGDNGILRVVSAAKDEGYYPWTIRGHDGTNIIRDDGHDAYWGLTDGLAGEKVVYGPDRDDNKQKWIFVRYVKPQEPPEDA